MREDFYETEADRVRRRLRSMPFRARLSNWWHYHWKSALAALAALAVMAYLLSSHGSAPPADYTIGWVGRGYLSAGEAERLAAAFAPFGEDVNDDGRVEVQLHQIALDLRAVAARGTSGQQEYADLLALDADLNAGQSVLFILEDPEAFQSYSGALLRLDGSKPAAGTDWRELALAWPEALGEPPDGADGPVYLACRGCWKEDQRAAWRASRALWEKIAAATSPPST